MTRNSVNDDAFAARLLELARLLHAKEGRQSLVETCQGHGIRGFLQDFPNLWTAIVDSSPQEGLISDRQYRLRAVTHGLSLAIFQERTLACLNQAGIPVMAIKGASLSQVLYGDITARVFGDLDLFVSPRMVRDAVSILQQAGYKRAYPGALQRGQEIAFWHYLKAQNLSDGQHSLDLHWRLLSAWVGSDLLPFEAVWSRSRWVEKRSLTPWRTLGDADNLVLLALHGFQHGWSKLKLLLDFCVALEVLNYDWGEVLEIAGYRAVLVEQAAELCVRLLGVSHPTTMTSHYRDNDQARSAWLEMASASKTPQSKLLGPGLWSCSSFEALVRAGRAMFCPAIDDLQCIEIPPAFYRLYPFVRLIRLAKKSVERFWSLVRTR